MALAVLAVLMAGCGDGRTETQRDDPADASAGTSNASSSAPRVVATAIQLAASVPDLARRLAPSAGAWRADGASLSSPGARASSAGNLGAWLPTRASGALRIGLRQSEAHTFTLTPQAARDVEVEEVEGRAVYRDAYEATDVLFVATQARVEWMYLLRDPSAPSRFTYALSLPPGLPQVTREAAGGLAFVDANGEARLHVPEPYALDAKGTRRAARVTAEHGELVVSLDTAGLVYPVLLDPAVETPAWR